MNLEAWNDRRDYFVQMLREEAADEDRWIASHQHKPASRLEHTADCAAAFRALATQIAALRFPATPQDTPDAPCICDYDDEDTDWHTQACVDRAATPQDTPDPHDGHPYAYVDDCPDCEAARWPSTPQP